MIVEDQSELLLDEFRGSLNKVNDSMIREVECPQCHMMIKIPLVVSSQDRERFYVLINYLEEAISEHPKVSRAMINDIGMKLSKLKEKYGD